MKLQILGCDGSYPDAHGACSGYLVCEGDDCLQLDLGCGSLPRLMAHTRPESLGAILISHWHNDHASDMLALAYYLKIHQLKLPVLAPVQPHPLRDLLEGEEFVFEDISMPRTIAGFHIQALAVDHPLPAYALKISRNGRALVYTGDAAGGAGLADFCRGADLLLCDATFTKAQWHEDLPHFSAHQAGQLARDAGVKQLVITHLQPGSDKELLLREAREAYANARMALPGLSIKL